MRVVAFATFLAVLATSSAIRAETPLRLRVVSWNVWGVPVITPRLDERIQAIPDALAALEPDIVCLQELWEPRHSELVSKRLAARGFRDFHRFDGPRGRSGLFVASRWPLRGGAFRPFSIGRMPHSLWHLDWMVEKGVGDVIVQTPLGALRLENTHLQAQYRTDRYAAERLAQAVEIVLGDRERTDEARLLAGDFNGGGDELPRHTLRDLGNLEDASPASDEDSVYARSGRDMAVRVVSARTHLPMLLDPENGGMEALSDHAAVVVELELTRCADCARTPRVVSTTRAAAVASLERAADSTPFRVVLALLSAGTLLVLGVAAKRRMGVVTRGSRRRVALRVLALAILAACFVWCSYLGALYYPTRAKLLRQVAGELASLPAR
ncbi:MAG TPA: endonuclease/exonuclease/phosphatase family protein [Polyangiaceae bacterium]|nr:endonuclease/exonuclease/phosphatase family protein [Polyangiaceae bacterium]